MKFPMNALSLVLAAVAGAGAGGAVAYNQFAGAPSARVEAPSAATTAPTVQAEPTAQAPAPQVTPALQAEAQKTPAEAPRAQPSGQAPSSTSQPQATQSGGADVTELQKQVVNHEMRIERLEQDTQTNQSADTKASASSGQTNQSGGNVVNSLPVNSAPVRSEVDPSKFSSPKDMTGGGGSK